LPLLPERYCWRLTPVALHAQEKETKTLEKEKPAEPTPPPPKEESSSTTTPSKIAGQTIPYKAVAQTIMLKNEKEEPQALIYSTSYFRTDSKDPARPISFIYNGGPGSASVWLHMGAFGPRRVLTANAESTPPPPYKLQDNAGTCSTRPTWSSSIQSAPAQPRRRQSARQRLLGASIRT